MLPRNYISPRYSHAFSFLLLSSSSTSPFFPQREQRSPQPPSPQSLLSNDVTSLVSPGAEVCSDREDTGARRQISFEFLGKIENATFRELGRRFFESRRQLVRFQLNHFLIVSSGTKSQGGLLQTDSSRYSHPFFTPRQLSRVETMIEARDNLVAKPLSLVDLH